MKIELNQLTEYERAFVKAAVSEYNDLMFTDDLNHGIPKQSLSGVVSSLVKKGIVECGEGTMFEFAHENPFADWEERKPELV